MRHWSEARRKALVDQAQRLEPMFGNLSTTVRDLGFDSWRFSVLDPNPLSPPLLMKTTLDDSFVDRYIEQRLYIEDPCYQHGRVSLQPLHWQPALFSQTPVLWQMMRDVGVNHGMSQACHHTNGWAAVLCFERSRPELGVDEFQDKASTLLSLTSHLAVATVEPVANDGTIGLPIRYMDKLLTKREITVLEQTAAGHTAAQIAADMSLSERTVQFHISSAITKLQVPNKTALVAQAILRGYIDWPLPDLDR